MLNTSSLIKILEVIHDYPAGKDGKGKGKPTLAEKIRKAKNWHKN